MSNKKRKIYQHRLKGNVERVKSFRGSLCCIFNHQRDKFELHALSSSKKRHIYKCQCTKNNNRCKVAGGHSIGGLIEESLHDILQTLFYHGEGNIHSAFSNVVEHLMLDPLRKEVIENILKSHFGSIWHNDAALKRNLNPMFSSSAFTASIATCSLIRKLVTSRRRKKRAPLCVKPKAHFEKENVWKAHEIPPGCSDSRRDENTLETYQNSVRNVITVCASWEAIKDIPVCLYSRRRYAKDFQN